MTAHTINPKSHESLGHSTWSLLVAMVRELMHRCRATADPFESGFLPN